jgi:hypothetical protein
MLKYVDSEPYRADKGVIHFVLIALCVAIILMGGLVYFY